MEVMNVMSKEYAESLIRVCEGKSHLTPDEFENLYGTSVIDPYRYHGEEVKHFYAKFRNKISPKAKVKLAKIRIFSLYFRSLHASDFSPKHPSYGIYGAAILGEYRLWEPDEITFAQLKKEFGERPDFADAHMKLGASYWQCD
jgi:hypothetical protein